MTLDEQIVELKKTRAELVEGLEKIEAALRGEVCSKCAGEGSVWDGDELVPCGCVRIAEDVE